MRRSVTVFAADRRVEATPRLRSGRMLSAHLGRVNVPTVIAQ